MLGFVGVAFEYVLLTLSQPRLLDLYLTALTYTVSLARFLDYHFAHPPSHYETSERLPNSNSTST